MMKTIPAEPTVTALGLSSLTLIFLRRVLERLCVGTVSCFFISSVIFSKSTADRLTAHVHMQAVDTVWGTDGGGKTDIVDVAGVAATGADGAQVVHVDVRLRG